MMIKLFCNHDYVILNQHKQLSTVEQMLGSGVHCKNIDMYPAVVLTIYKCCKCDKVKESKVVMD